MSHEREVEGAANQDAASVDKPSGPAPDQGKAYDPAMTDEDEANLPPDSDADPNASGEAH